MISAVQKEVAISPHSEEYLAVGIVLPKDAGGYLLVSELIDSENNRQVSRRYIRVGPAAGEVTFPDYPIQVNGLDR